MSERDPLLPTSHPQPNGAPQEQSDDDPQLTLTALARFSGALRAGKLPTTEQFVKIDQKLLQSNVLNANQVLSCFSLSLSWICVSDVETRWLERPHWR
jgi:hypothetical protein